MRFHEIGVPCPTPLVVALAVATWPWCLVWNQAGTNFYQVLAALNQHLLQPRPQKPWESRAGAGPEPGWGRGCGPCSLRLSVTRLALGSGQALPARRCPPCPLPARGPGSLAPSPGSGTAGAGLTHHSSSPLPALQSPSLPSTGSGSGADAILGEPVVLRAPIPPAAPHTAVTPPPLPRVAACLLGRAGACRGCLAGPGP